jgi:hypothetical protein
MMRKRGMKVEKVEGSVKLFPMHGSYLVKVKVPIPIIVRENICHMVRSYSKQGLMREAFKQIFMNGYDLIERTCGLDNFIKQIYEEKKKLRKHGGRGRPPNGNWEVG